MLIEIHMLQNHAPANLNRDDTGSPKEALFGGALRARISSQCLKRSIRQSPIFQQAMQGHLGTRTRRLPAEIKSEVLALGASDEAATLIAKKATAFGSGKEGDEGETRQLIFLDRADVAPLARELKATYDEVGAAAFAKLTIADVERRLAHRPPCSVDIALFGRFTTSAAFEDVEASLQVAHAISTGKVEKQFDYFTAVDDLQKDTDDHGAGMIGDVEFNSATFYKYFSLDWEALVKNLGGDADTARAAVGALIKAAALTTPSGKQNSFAAHNPPDAILVEVKGENVPTSYANAFVNPVRASAAKDVMEASIEALSTYAAQLKGAYGIEPLRSACLTVRGQEVAGATRMPDLGRLIAAVAEPLGAEEAPGVAS
ncbi:MAG: type I-E CRISPR-associated protein Cas7/Cse4/CasC [Chloroflexota bacterium]